MLLNLGIFYYQYQAGFVRPPINLNKTKQTKNPHKKIIIDIRVLRYESITNFPISRILHCVFQQTYSIVICINCPFCEALTLPVRPCLFFCLPPSPFSPPLKSRLFRKNSPEKYIHVRNINALKKKR